MCHSSGTKSENKAFSLNPRSVRHCALLPLVAGGGTVGKKLFKKTVKKEKRKVARFSAAVGKRHASVYGKGTFKKTFKDF